jgi:Fe-S-cluster-containing dehydrogenase component
MKHNNAALIASVVLSIIAVCTPVAQSDGQPATTKPAGSTLRIVNDNLVKVDDGDCIGCLYAVKGSIYNPNSVGVKNVVIRYYIWKKWMGKDEHGSAAKETGGLVSATIKYLPPKQTIDFIATSHNAAVMIHDVPDPISAEVTAEWDE